MATINGNEEDGIKGVWGIQTTYSANVDADSDRATGQGSGGKGTLSLGVGGTTSSEPCSNHDAGERDLGKIISQVRELGKSHLAYVRSHKKRLQQRLEESNQYEEKVIELMASIEEAFAQFQQQDRAKSKE